MKGRRSALAALSLLLCAPAVVWTADLLRSTPPLILAASTAPAALLAAVILRAQRGEQRPRGGLAFALVWGAVVAAFLSSTGNELARSTIRELAGENARSATALLVAPLLEEGAKALGLAVLFLSSSAWWRNARDGIVYGALVGVGFVWTENLLYLGVAMLQGGEECLVRALWLRGIVGGATHAVFTASFGAALGWWAARRGRAGAVRIAPAAGLAFAAVQHVAWNTLAAPAIVSALCGAAIAGGSCASEPTSTALFGVVTLIAVVFLAPGVAFATVAWRAAVPNERVSRPAPGAPRPAEDRADSR